jgi:hypothetical protein
MSSTTEEEINSLIGKYVLIGITRLDKRGQPKDQLQFLGDVTKIARENNSICIALRPDGKEYKVPLDLRAFKPAAPGDYRLRSTGEVVVNPDFIATWIVQEGKDSIESSVTD